MLTQDVQIGIYSATRSLESRLMAIEGTIRRLKNRCLDSDPTRITEFVEVTAELMWQLDQATDLGRQAGKLLGMASEGRKAAERPDDDEVDASQLRHIRGSTDVITVAELVGFLSSHHKTGSLTLRAGETLFVFEFQDGRVVHALTNLEDPEYRLGTILCAQDKLTDEQLHDVAAASSEANELLGTHLVRTAIVSESDLRQALDAQVRKIFDAAFDLKNAHFVFDEGSLSRIPQRAALSAAELLLEAARRQDEDRLTRDEVQDAFESLLKP